MNNTKNNIITEIVNFFNDDKNLVILSVSTIALLAMFLDLKPDQAKLVSQITTGLFGLAVGRASVSINK